MLQVAIQCLSQENSDLQWSQPLQQIAIHSRAKRGCASQSQCFQSRSEGIYYLWLYRVRTLTSHNAEELESENSPESPHLGEIKRMRKQCVPGASPFFARAGDEARAQVSYPGPAQLSAACSTEMQKQLWGSGGCSARKFWNF